MTSRRLLKAAEAIREVVSMAILADLKDPRIRDVTVIRVEVTPDMRQAKVYVSVMGDETKQNLSLRGLQSSAGFLQSKINKRIDTRYTPRLEFMLDQGVKKSLEISTLLEEVLPAEDNTDEMTSEDAPSASMLTAAGDDDPQTDSPTDGDRSD